MSQRLSSPQPAATRRRRAARVLPGLCLLALRSFDSFSEADPLVLNEV